MFHFRCPHCNAKLEAEDDWQGLETQCPNCQQNLHIPLISQQSPHPKSISLPESQSHVLPFHSCFSKKKSYLWCSAILLLIIAITGSGFYFTSQLNTIKTKPILKNKPTAEEKTGIPFPLNPSQYLPLCWGDTRQVCEKRISDFAVSNGFPDLYEGNFNGKKLYFKFDIDGVLVGIFYPTNLLELIQVVNLATQKFGNVGNFQDRLQLQWQHPVSSSVFVAQANQFIDGINYTIEVWAANIYPEILRNRLNESMVEAKKEKTYDRAIKVLELGIATNSNAPNLQEAENYLKNLKREYAAKIAAEEQRIREQQRVQKQQTQQRIREQQRVQKQQAQQQIREQQRVQKQQASNSCRWGCNGTGRLPDGMSCPDHSGPVREISGEAITQDTTPYCLRCGGSGKITQIIMPSGNTLINFAFRKQPPPNAQQVRRVCPTCNGSGKRYWESIIFDIK